MVKHYKCRNCGLDLTLEGDRDKEVKMCPTCGSGEVTKVKSKEESAIAEAMAVYKCGVCGLVYSLDSQPVFCPYCGGKEVNRWTTESLSKRMNRKIS